MIGRLEDQSKLKSILIGRLTVVIVKYASAIFVKWFPYNDNDRSDRSTSISAIVAIIMIIAIETMPESIVTFRFKPKWRPQYQSTLPVSWT